MKKTILLVLGLFVAGLAAMAIPREYQDHPVKIEIKTNLPAVISAEVISYDINSAPHDIVRMNFEAGKITTIQNQANPDILQSRFRWYSRLLLLNSNETTIFRRLLKIKAPILIAYNLRQPRNDL